MSPATRERRRHAREAAMRLWYGAAPERQKLMRDLQAALALPLAGAEAACGCALLARFARDGFLSPADEAAACLLTAHRRAASTIAARERSTRAPSPELMP